MWPFEKTQEMNVVIWLKTTPCFRKSHSSLDTKEILAQNLSCIRNVKQTL